jgi:hypothetical protein
MVNFMKSNRLRLQDDFRGALDPAWTVVQVRHGRVFQDEYGLVMHNDVARERQYGNAQITDYDYNSFQFRWSPPLRMSVTAKASTSALQGTAGFGFWNHPFSPDVEHVHRRFRLPQAIWFFFGSPPNNMALAQGVAGHGWKAATIDSGRPSALLLAPLALPSLLAFQVPLLYRTLYPHVQRGLAIGEAALDVALLAEEHTYTIDWHSDGATFRVDERVVLETPFAPRGALGFVAWLDNQYAIVTPQGQFGSGVISVAQSQTLWLKHVSVEQEGS